MKKTYLLAIVAADMNANDYDTSKLLILSPGRDYDTLVMNQSLTLSNLLAFNTGATIVFESPESSICTISAVNASVNFYPSNEGPFYFKFDEDAQKIIAAPPSLAKPW